MPQSTQVFAYICVVLGMCGVCVCVWQVEVPKALVGFVIGRNGEHINNIQNTCGVRLQFQNGKHWVSVHPLVIKWPQGKYNVSVLQIFPTQTTG